jgi:ribosomal protein S18 acetylase RimI-like enzyme
MSANQLIALLQDAVHDGASVGFIAPLSEAKAEEYWREAIQELASGRTLLLIAEEAGAIVGSVQLALAMRENGLHRAEVQKLMTHTAHRRKGIAATLMEAIEAEANCLNRSLLTLDTRKGDAAEILYRKLGYQEAGVIPQYAKSSSGELQDTIFFYRVL